MTANQINFWRLQEDKRHNVTGEGETRRHNLADEGIRSRTARETERHNLVTEYITTAHNVATEDETRRSNLAKEIENNRHNVATEAANVQSINDAWLINKYNADTTRGKAVSEIKRNESQSDYYNAKAYTGYADTLIKALSAMR